MKTSNIPWTFQFAYRKTDVVSISRILQGAVEMMSAANLPPHRPSGQQCSLLTFHRLLVRIGPQRVELTLSLRMVIMSTSRDRHC